MPDENDRGLRSVEPFPAPSPSTLVSDELDRILSILRAACPLGTRITFEFDGRLQVHIDVRKREEVTLVEAMLPALGIDLFHGISLGGTPHRPFFHRISALVRR